jgi:RNA polymerase sigma factor (sigma-70 family)
MQALMSHTDTALVAEILAGDEGAPQRFIARHDSFFRRTILSSSRAAYPLLDDLTHEVYVHLWRDDFRVLRLWHQEHTLQAYLQRAIRRLVWERLDRLRPAWEDLHDDPLNAAGALEWHSPVTPEEEACAQELVGLLRVSLDGINPKHRQILELRYFREFSYREIAGPLGITTTNTGARLNRALDHLKDQLRQLIGEKECFP